MLLANRQICRCSLSISQLCYGKPGCFRGNHFSLMQGISTLATIISVCTFSLTCIVVLYPTLSRFKSRWKGVAFYGGISAGTLLVAALTAPDPALPGRDWSWVDWTVLGVGVGTGLAVILQKKSY